VKRPVEGSGGIRSAGRAAELRHRREALLERSAGLRAALAAEGTALRDRFAVVDAAVGLARSVTQRPVLVAAAAAALMVLKPARALRYLARGAVVVSMVRRFLGWLDRQPR
jgi:hypothetical protein